MLVAPFRVVLDSCVLCSLSSRDLLRLAAEGTSEFFWSEQILDEVSSIDLRLKRLTLHRNGIRGRMLVAPFRVLLDANVLYPFSLRDTLLRAAAEGLFQPYWSEQILDEVERNLVGKGTILPEQALRLRRAMVGAFPEAMVTGHEPFIEAMANDDDDKHVAAAALRAGAQVIVTNNLRDFRELPEGIEAQSPDEFLCNLFDLDPEGIVELIERQAAALKNPPRSFEALLRGLAKMVPEFARSIAEHRSR